MPSFMGTKFKYVHELSDLIRLYSGLDVLIHFFVVLRHFSYVYYLINVWSFYGVAGLWRVARVQISVCLRWTGIT